MKQDSRTAADIRIASKSRIMHRQTPTSSGAQVLSCFFRVFLRLAPFDKVHFAPTASVREHFYESWWTTISCTSIH